MVFSETPTTTPLLAILQILPLLTGLVLIRVRGNAAVAVAGSVSVLELFALSVAKMATRLSPPARTTS